jgi:ATP-dependent DNA ligase
MMAYEYNLAPKSLDEQCAAFKKKYPTLDDLPSVDYIMMPKYDGCLAIITPDGVITRTGEPISSMGHVAEQAQQLLPGYVIFGEAYKFATPFKDISGRFRRHAQQPDLFVVAFDAVPVDDWKAGRCDKPYIERYTALQEAVLRTPTPSLIVASALDLGAPRGFANALVAIGGYDGAILRRKDAPWTTGASKNGEAIKVKPVQSLDLEVHSWFRGKGKHAQRAGGITVLYRGVQSDVGTGFTDHEREEIASAGQAPCAVAEIEFMELTADGKLREPRFKGWRHDKTEPDQ